MDVPARARLTSRSAPAATAAALVGTLAAVLVALALHAATDAEDAHGASRFLVLFTTLFALRVAGQLVPGESTPS